MQRKDAVQHRQLEHLSHCGLKTAHAHRSAEAPDPLEDGDERAEARGVDLTYSGEVDDERALPLPHCHGHGILEGARGPRLEERLRGAGDEELALLFQLDLHFTSIVFGSPIRIVHPAPWDRAS